MAAAREARIPLVRRAEMLAELMRQQTSIAVAGAHGKTTTTSMVAAVLDAGGLDPTVVNGGVINAYGANAKIGEGDWIVVEADESDGAFLTLRCTVAVVTNIDREHLDHYGGFDALKKAFQDFIQNIPFYSFAVLCTDDAVVQEVAARVENRRLITYGLNPQAQVRAVNLNMGPDGASFDVAVALGEGARPDVSSPASPCPWPAATMSRTPWRRWPSGCSSASSRPPSRPPWRASAGSSGASPPPAWWAACASSTTTATTRWRSPRCSRPPGPRSLAR